MKPSRYFFAALLISLLIMSAASAAKKPETGFLDRVTTLNGVVYKYQVFLPDNWSRDRKWPVILFLHGAGQRGTDGVLQTDIGLAAAIRNSRDKIPAVIVIPQCRPGVWWIDAPMYDLAMKTLAEAQKEFHGDPQRIYLTGISMGGYGSWYLAEKYPGKFAAVAVVCGGILRPEASRRQDASNKTPYTEAAAKIGSKTPIWIFHGGADDTVPVEESRNMNDALKAIGADVQYTEYPGVGHNSWSKAYAEPGLYLWMFSKSLSAK